MISSLLNYRKNSRIYKALVICILALFFYPSIFSKIYAVVGTSSLYCNTDTIVNCNTEEKKSEYFQGILEKIRAMKVGDPNNNCPINDPSIKQSGQINDFYNQCWNNPYGEGGKGVSAAEEYTSYVSSQCGCYPDDNAKKLYKIYFIDQLKSELSRSGITPPPTPSYLPTGYIPAPLDSAQTPTPVPFHPYRGEHGGPCNLVDFTSGETLGLVSDGIKSIPYVGETFGNIFDGLANIQTDIFGRVFEAFMTEPADFNKKDGNLYQYYFGCSPGNICASSRDVKSIPGLENLQLDNVCVKESLWMSYLNEKRKRSKNPQQASQTAPTQNTPTNKTLVQALATTATPQVKLKSEDISQAIASMCYRSIPFAEKLGFAFLGQQAPNGNIIGSIYGNSPGGFVLGADFLNKYINMPKYINAQFQDGEDGLEELKNQCALNQSGCSVVNISSMSSLAEVVKAIPDEKYEKAGIPKKSISSFKSSMATCIECASRGEMSTAIGCIPVTDTSSFIAKTVFGIALGIAGSFCLLCIIYGAILIQFGGENAKNIDSGRKMITQCIVGLIVIIFSLFILRFIGVELLRIPGLG